MVDQAGFTVNYAYDSVGRLSRAHGWPGNLIVHYSYDAAGRPRPQGQRQRTYTTYAYDAASECSTW